MPKIKLGNTQLFFDVYGSQLSISTSDVKEKPVLLVLHGGPGIADHTIMVEFWSQFSDVTQVIFLDLRGCGRSDKCMPSEWNLKSWGQDVHDFCETLGIQKPIVAGVSIGGHVLCEYATRYPEHPGALIFCNTEAKMDVAAMVEKFRELGGDEIAEICQQNFLSPTPETVVAYRDRCVPFYAKNAYSKSEIQRCLQRLEVYEYYYKNEIQQFDYRNQLHKIQCPVLFMVGEKSPGHPPQLAKIMANEIDVKWVHYHEFKEAGAPVYKDAPEESACVVSQFIQETIERKQSVN